MGDTYHRLLTRFSHFTLMFSHIGSDRCVDEALATVYVVLASTGGSVVVSALAAVILFFLILIPGINLIVGLIAGGVLGGPGGAFRRPCYWWRDLRD